MKMQLYGLLSDLHFVNDTQWPANTKHYVHRSGGVLVCTFTAHRRPGGASYLPPPFQMLVFLAVKKSV